MLSEFKIESSEENISYDINGVSTNMSEKKKLKIKLYVSQCWRFELKEIEMLKSLGSSSPEVPPFGPAPVPRILLYSKINNLLLKHSESQNIFMENL